MPSNNIKAQKSVKTLSNTNMLKVGRYMEKEKSLLCPTNECWPQWHFSKNAFLDLFQWDILLTPFLILWGNQINCFSFWRYKNTQMATLPDNVSCERFAHKIRKERKFVDGRLLVELSGGAACVQPALQGSANFQPPQIPNSALQELSNKNHNQLKSTCLFRK